MANFIATVLGNLDFPAIREVNVRTGPAVINQLLFRVAVGLQADILAIQADSTGSAKDGKVYQWLNLDFGDGRQGWVRDDLIAVEGDGSAFGYGFIPQRTQAFALARTVIMPTPNVPDPTPAPPRPEPTEPAEPTDSQPESVPPMPTPSGEEGHALTMGRDGVNVRRGAGTVFEPVGRFPHRTRCRIVGAQPEHNRASRFKWVNVEAQGTTGWIREDLLRYVGDVERHGLAYLDAYPAPMEHSWWVRDWNTDPNFAAIHYGWDLGAVTGEPVLAGPTGGLVVQVTRCTACTQAQPNVLSQGRRLNDPAVLQDPAWGFGYGNYVVVRYLHDQLPASTRAELQRRNLTGYHIFTIYAHLNTIDVQAGQVLQPNQRVGGCGNTGNSEATHLHLEIRAWNNPNETSTGRMIANRMDPVVLFRR
ncbi:MAG: M23 family metallopeptidase [Chloroflexi bacterium]|nr:M23 family metallopeptidase [Chloroflexota bacterium]